MADRISTRVKTEMGAQEWERVKQELRRKAVEYAVHGDALTRLQAVFEDTYKNNPGIIGDEEFKEAIVLRDRVQAFLAEPVVAAFLDECRAITTAFD